MAQGKNNDFEAFLTRLSADLEQGVLIRRRLPFGGRLVIDRPLPFICVYRQPPEMNDKGSWRLISGEASYVVAPGAPALRPQLRKLLQTIAGKMIERFGAFMVLEIWTERQHEPPQDAGASIRPSFKVYASRRKKLDPLIETLQASLEKIRNQRRSAYVETHRTPGFAPPGMRPLFSSQTKNIVNVGLAVKPIFRDVTGQLFPLALRRLRKRLAPALRRAFHRFSATLSTEVPVSFLAYGRQTMVKGVLEADAELARIRESFDMLLLVTPIDVKRAWGAFQRSDFEKEPVFHYRPIPVDPGLLKRALFSLKLEKIEDPTLADLFREIQMETDRQLTMLMDRATRRFYYGSMQLYGHVQDSLVQTARELLTRLPAKKREGGQTISADEFAVLARNEISSYREGFPEFSSQVQVRDDLYSGLMVSRGNLLIGRTSQIPVARVRALLAHEVGTHCVTYQNGRAQKFKQLSLGLPNYDELQEGLAVTAEFLSGGLDKPRLRLLAARVIAASMMERGATFVETFRVLTREWRFAQTTAFTIAMRVYRGGGITKDAVYLKGLLQVLEYLGKGRDLPPLYVGKISVNHLPVVKELQYRKILKPAPVLPSFLASEKARHRLQWLREGRTVPDLIEGVKA